MHITLRFLLCLLIYNNLYCSRVTIFRPFIAHGRITGLNPNLTLLGVPKRWKNARRGRSKLL